MSGQPIKTPSDANKFRNEYMETLALQEQINDMNLQANKTYLLTGQLPPQSQMQDTRTTAEKLKDVEMLKHKIAEQLRPIAEPQFAYAIVNKVIESPLNVDNSLFRFLAQRASSIADELKKTYTFGIAGDADDLEKIVESIRKMYSTLQRGFQSTKSYMNSVSSSTSKSNIISSNDIDRVLIQVQDLMKELNIIANRVPVGFLPVIQYAIDNLTQILGRIKTFLPSTKQMEKMLEDLSQPANAGINPYTRGALPAFNGDELSEVFKILEKLPKYEIIHTLLERCKSYIKSANYKLVVDSLNAVIKEFAPFENPDVIAILNNFANILQRQTEKIIAERDMNETQTREFIRAQTQQDKDRSKATKVYVINPDNDPVRGMLVNPPAGGDGGAGGAPLGLPAGGQQQPQQPQQAIAPPNAGNAGANMAYNFGFNNPMMFNPYWGNAVYAQPHLFDFALHEGDDNLMAGQDQLGGFQYDPSLPLSYQLMFGNRRPEPVELPPLEGSFDYPVLPLQTYGGYSNIPKITDDEIREYVNRGLDSGFDMTMIAPALQRAYRNRQISNKGLTMGLNMLRRYGRGINQNKRSSFVGFGISEINNKSLDKDIITIRRAGSKSNYMDFPSKKVSKKLSNIVKTIVGGGVPNFNDINSLDNDEKDYLYKLVEKANLKDRLSVPAPSKDQQEKDIHNFEVMKGQIMSGNDSKELVKKFKLLVVKLTRQGLLPKAESTDLMDLLTELGY